MTNNVPKLVTTTHYHLWTDALHARALATQARNEWDRGVYVRWAVNTAWTVFETVCEDALDTTGLGNRFKEKLDEAISDLSLPPLDWGKGLWQKVFKVYRLRKEYVHVALPQKRLFADVAEANNAISILREAVKAIYQHANKTPPNWINDDRDRGWDRPFGNSAIAFGNGGSRRSGLNLVGDRSRRMGKPHEHSSPVRQPA